MAEINNRRFSRNQLAGIFRELDAGGTRADVRAYIKRSQGRGVSNDTIRALRETHRQLRRSQGYLVGQRGRRNLIDPQTGRLRLLKDFPHTLPPSRRPQPPPGLRVKVSVEYTKRDANGRELGRAVGSFTVGPDEPSLDEQISAAEEGVEETLITGPGGGKGRSILGVRGL